MKKTLILAIAALVALSAGNIVSAQTVSGSANVDAMLAQLKIVRQLQQGMSGDDVKLLQTILATQPDIYPEGLVTGKYGPLTTKAVQKYQEKFGLQIAGRVGPKTLEKLNDFVNFNVASTLTGSSTPSTHDDKVCVKVPPGHLIAPGWQKKHGNENITVPTCQTLPPGILGKLGMGTTTRATTTPNIPALVFSSITATNINASTTQVNWSTNIFGTTKVVYGTSTPLTATSSVASNSTFGTTHSINLTNLATSTIYYYQVSSANIYGAVTTSGIQQFLTLVQ